MCKKVSFLVGNICIFVTSVLMVCSSYSLRHLVGNSGRPPPSLFAPRRRGSSAATAIGQATAAVSHNRARSCLPLSLPSSLSFLGFTPPLRRLPERPIRPSLPHFGPLRVESIGWAALLVLVRALADGVVVLLGLFVLTARCAWDALFGLQRGCGGWPVAGSVRAGYGNHSLAHRCWIRSGRI
jgi:hypothetical protein